MSHATTHSALRTLLYVASGLLVALGIWACSSTDCTLNNTVYTNYALMGRVTKLPDTLTILTTRRDAGDSVIINRQTDTERLSLPMSYTAESDSFIYQVNHTRDTVVVYKTNQPHFESADCGMVYFHHITQVHYTTHNLDSVVINHPDVTYDAQPIHFHLYFKSYRD